MDKFLILQEVQGIYNSTLFNGYVLLSEKGDKVVKEKNSESWLFLEELEDVEPVGKLIQETIEEDMKAIASQLDWEKISKDGNKDNIIQAFANKVSESSPESSSNKEESKKIATDFANAEILLSKSDSGDSSASKELEKFKKEENKSRFKKGLLFEDDYFNDVVQNEYLEEFYDSYEDFSEFILSDDSLDFQYNVTDEVYPEEIESEIYSISDDYIDNYPNYIDDETDFLNGFCNCLDCSSDDYVEQLNGENLNDIIVLIINETIEKKKKLLEVSESPDFANQIIKGLNNYRNSMAKENKKIDSIVSVIAIYNTNKQQSQIIYPYAFKDHLQVFNTFPLKTKENKKVISTETCNQFSNEVFQDLYNICIEDVKEKINYVRENSPEKYEEFIKKVKNIMNIAFNKDGNFYKSLLSSLIEIRKVFCKNNGIEFI